MQNLHKQFVIHIKKKQFSAGFFFNSNSPSECEKKCGCYPKSEEGKL